MIRFQEGAVSSQTSCVNFGRTAIATANDKQAPAYYIFKQNVKHMGDHVLLDGSTCVYELFKNNLLIKKTKSITRIMTCVIIVMMRVKIIMAGISSTRYKWRCTSLCTVRYWYW